MQALGVAPGASAQQQQQQKKAGQKQHGQQQPADVVASSWGHAIVVWNLLTGGVSWYASLPVCSLAADPAHSVFAVGVPAVLSCSSAAPAGAQQQQQQQAQRQGLVLVFDAHKADPLYACPVPASSPTSLLFVQGKSAAAADGGAAQVSPLMLLTQDRRYTRLSLGATAAAAGGQQQPDAAAAAAESGVPLGTRAALEAEAAAGRDESVLEAMFGRMEQTASAAADSGAAAAAAEAAAVKAAVSQLFDAPSHVLPAPSSLCPTLLELLIGAGRK
jgi:hypothetical protein